MPRLPKCFRSWPMLMGLAGYALLPVAHGASAIDDPSAFLDHVETLRTKDHAQFVALLKQFHREKPTLDQATRWHLRYLDTWETQFEGDYKTSEAQLKDIIANASDPDLAVKASSLLLNNYIATDRYEQGYSLANHLAAALPGITNVQTRYMLLTNLSTLLNFAGQVDVAVNYANMMESAMPPGESACYPKFLRVAALETGRRITSASRDVHDAIETCIAGHQALLANATSLVLGDLLLAEGKPSQVLSMLDGIDPSIRSVRYHPQIIDAGTQRALAYEALGRDDDAQKAAMGTLHEAPADETSQGLMKAYGVLYRIEKKRGNALEALSYYERFVEQNKVDRNDITARTLAFELSQQHVLVQKLQTESLARQNNVLRLQQSLDAKAVETSRFYIVALIGSLLLIGVWAYRTKRAQLRFQKISHRDGLTGIYHHQHFMGEAERCLRALHKRSAHGCLVSIDLDHFKQVNDTHGHAVGDAVLRHVVAVCKQQLRPHDIFGRLGGEEFGILLVDCPSAEGIFVADRIRMAIEASPLMEDGRMITLSASVGVSCTGKSGYTLQKLCRDSDAALYRAKRSGRNRVVAHTEEDNQLIDGMPGSSLSNVTG